jgi:hypothetical protein
MHIRFPRVKLLWVVTGFGLGLGLGSAAPAFADVGAAAGATSGAASGAISGGFFAANALPPELPEPGALAAGPAPRAGNGVCEKAVAAASAGHQLPPGLLSAIATVESGRLDPRTATLKPWPWTIDANGAGSMYDSAATAIQAAAAFEAAGINSLDIGCLQVNLAQHPDAFQSLAQAFDPMANADYAAAFLSSLEQKFGNWPQAVAAYHSQTPALGEPYAAKVYAAWQAAPGGAPVALAAFADQGNAAMPSAIPPAVDISSLAPPMAILMQPGRTLSNRGLASYRASPVAIATNIAPSG